MNNINYNDLKNICRTCSLNCDVKFTQDAVISDIFYRLTDIPFETNDDLPKQICSKCFEKIIEIREFSMRCKQTHSTLMECLNNYKNIEIKVEQETNELPEIKDEITIEDHEIEFVKVEEEELDQNTNNSRDDLLNDHKRVHSGERPYNCDQCDMTFKHLITLKFHKRKHSGKLYKCDQCSKTYTQSGNLVAHKRNHSGERPYKCNQCTKAFTKADSLKLHKRTHSGERPYKCDICPKAFMGGSGLIVHKRIHSGERPYKCDICPKAFTEGYKLKLHKRTHSGERPYK